MEDGDLWLLGSGAMGLTYKAEDLHLHRPVALKLISPLLTESRLARELFLAEARGAASLRHRNVAAVHHLGTQGDAFFYVMEFVEGETVETLVRRQGRLETTFALDIVQQTACALAAAGRRALVHRDLKPGNLMLTDEGDGALVVKVIDFGLCKSLGPTASGAHPKPGASTGGDGFFGTPHYASPEQIRNDPGVDGRADFYSLGASLWQMLTGRPPFAGDLALVREQHLRADPPWTRLPADLPEAVRALLARLLAKDPAVRPQTPAELIDEIALAEFASKAEDPRGTWKTQGCIPLLGTLLAHNYHLEALVSDEPDGPVFRAEDLAGGRLVSVKLFDRHGGSLDHIRAAVARLAGAAHPNLLEDEEVTSCRGQPFLVTEWVNGFPLSDVLRARGKLTPAETQSLVHQAARALDHARERGLGALDLRTGAAMVQFTGPALAADARRTLPGRPLGEWPMFLLKFRLLGGDHGDAGLAAGVRALGHFAAELLGQNDAETAWAAPAGVTVWPSFNLPGVPPSVATLIGHAVAESSGYTRGTEFAEALSGAVRGV